MGAAGTPTYGLTRGGGGPGSPGPQGPPGPPGFLHDLDPPDEPLLIPGPQGVQGIQGPAGAGGGGSTFLFLSDPDGDDGWTPGPFSPQAFSKDPFSQYVLLQGRPGLANSFSLTTDAGGTGIMRGTSATTGGLELDSNASFNGTISLEGNSVIFVGSGAATELQLYDAVPSHFVGIAAPAAVTSTYHLTMPAVQGAGALTNNGAGVLSWTPAGASATQAIFMLLSDPEDIEPIIPVGAFNSLTKAQLPLPLDHHADLTNFIANDDHTQYVLRGGRLGATNNFAITSSVGGTGAIAGTTGLTGNLDLSANSVGASSSGEILLHAAHVQLHNGALGSDPPVQLWFNEGSGSVHAVQVQAPAVVPASYLLKLPDAQGTGALTNDGVGNLSWNRSTPPVFFNDGIDGEDGFPIPGVPSPQLASASIAFTDGDTERRVTISNAAIKSSSLIVGTITRPDTTDTTDKGYIYVHSIARRQAGSFDLLVAALDWGFGDPVPAPPNETITFVYMVQ